MMSASIFESIKTMLGPDIDNSFDQDILIHINSALASLAQVGACPKGSMISGATETWSTIFSSQAIAAKAKVYIYYKVRLGFDPPQNSFAIESMKSLADEELWRINSDADYDDEDDD